MCLHYMRTLTWHKNLTISSLLTVAKYHSNYKLIVGFVCTLNQTNGIASFERVMQHPSKVNEIACAMGGLTGTYRGQSIKYEDLLYLSNVLKYCFLLFPISVHLVMVWCAKALQDENSQVHNQPVNL